MVMCVVLWCLQSVASKTSAGLEDNVHCWAAPLSLRESASTRSTAIEPSTASVALTVQSPLPLLRPQGSHVSLLKVEGQQDSGGDEDGELLLDDHDFSDYHVRTVCVCEPMEVECL